MGAKTLRCHQGEPANADLLDQEELERTISRIAKGVAQLREFRRLLHENIVSTCAVDQVGLGHVEGHGFERQAETIASFAKARGLELVHVYREAHTGTESERPVFADMLAALLANGARVVIVESLDRLARDVMVQTLLLAKLIEHGITLFSATTGEDVTASIREDPMREALVTVQGAFAQAEKKLLVRKLRKAREAIRARGERCEGVRPHYGPEVVEAIRTLRRKRKGERLSWARCAAELQARGLRTKSGAPWRDWTVQKIAKREGIQ